ncbi:MAG: hypothetical protein OQL19_20525 [Gammaproteobacteria bacterium]|nr:hypothetical protein [Gammaproteobacteria bacterium]
MLWVSIKTFSFTKEGNRVISTTLSWEHNGNNICIDCQDDVQAIYADKLEKVVVELFLQNRIAFYSNEGELSFEIPLPSLDGCSFRGLNKSIKSKTGVSIIFNPEDDKKKNKWNDMVQYELLTNAPYISECLEIYR